MSSCQLSAHSSFECQTSDSSCNSPRNGTLNGHAISCEGNKELHKTHKGESKARQQTKIKCSRCRCWKNEIEFINQGDGSRIMRTCNSCRRRNKYHAPKEGRGAVAKRSTKQGDETHLENLTKETTNELTIETKIEPSSQLEYIETHPDFSSTNSEVKPELASVPTVSNETASVYSAYVPQCELVPPCYPYPICGMNPSYGYPSEYPKIMNTQRFSQSPGTVYPSYSFPVQTGISPVPYLYPYQIPRNGSEYPIQGRPVQSIPIPSFRFDANFNGPTNNLIPLERKRQRPDYLSSFSKNLELLAAISRQELCSLENKQLHLSVE